ncbi:MAG: helix-turn-helix domain-containing protein [Jejuia sp.]
MLNIKEVIKENGYSVTSLAEKLEMTQVSLSRIINGNPTVETLEKIANALDVDVKDFFTSENEKAETIYAFRNGSYVAIGELEKN